MLPPGRTSCRAPGPSTTLWSSPITWIASAIREANWVALTAANARSREPCRMRKATAIVKTTSPGLILPLLHRDRDQINIAPAINHKLKSCNTRIRSIYIRLSRCAVVSVCSSWAKPRRSRDVRGECLDRPDVGDNIDQRAADFGSTVGIGTMARSAAPAQKGKGADRQQHEHSQRGYELPVDGRQDHQRRTKIGTDRGDVEQHD